MVLGEMDVTRVNPYRFGQGHPPVLSAWFQCCRPTAVTQIRGGGGDSMSASYPVYDVHQAWMTKGDGEWGMTFGEDKKRDWSFNVGLA